MTADTKISIGSTSKTITAAAVMRAIEILTAKGKSVSIDTPMAQYLPTGWTKGPHVGEITLKDLMRHSSGLLPSKDLYEELKAMIAAGPSATNWATRMDSPGSKYCNCNFTLFRIILPYMVYGREAIEGSPQVAAQAAALEAEIAALQAELQTASPAEKPAIAAQIKQLQKQKAKLPGQPSESIEIRTAKLYVQFVQEQVLAKIGLGSAWINPKGASQLITYYNFKNPAKTFTGYSDDTALRGTGAGFWFMSAKEYGKFIGGLRTGKIISAASYQTMVSNRLGMFGSQSEAGMCVEHNGAFTYQGEAGMRGAWIAFPNGVTGVVYMNSVNPDLPAPQTILRTAFNAAFKLQQLAAN
jgi:CubicO group peptidase (beta-lactamase class C family)